jgi:hypothetical protein
MKRTDKNHSTEADPLPVRRHQGDHLWDHVDLGTWSILNIGGIALFNSMRPNVGSHREKLLTNPDRLAEANESEAWNNFRTVHTAIGMSNAVRNQYDTFSLPARSREEELFRATLRQELNAPALLADVLQMPIRNVDTEVMQPLPSKRDEQAS